MQQTVAKVVGIVQGLLGAGGAALPELSAGLDSGTGGNLFNLISGAVLSYLGFKGSGTTQQTGLKVLGGLNGLLGALGAAGTLPAGLGFGQGGASSWIQIAIGVISLVAGFMKQRS
jgi:hypothetical protein